MSAHFGHAAQFAFFDTDPQTGKIQAEEIIDSPPHQPGALPAWIAQHKATVVLAGGMGGRARELFAQHGIEVVVGVSAEQPRQAVEAYLRGALSAGENICDHGRRKCH